MAFRAKQSMTISLTVHCLKPGQVTKSLIFDSTKKCDNLTLFRDFGGFDSFRSGGMSFLAAQGLRWCCVTEHTQQTFDSWLENMFRTRKIFLATRFFLSFKGEITTCRAGVLLTVLREGNKCDANPGWRSNHPVNASLGRLNFKNWFNWRNCTEYATSPGN